MIRIENLNNFLYGSKSKVYTSLRYLSFAIILSGIGLLIASYGFELKEEDAKSIFIWINIIFGLSIFSYLVRILYSFERTSFLKRTFFESSLLGLIVINAVANLISGDRVLTHFFNFMGVQNSNAFYDLIVTLYLGLIIAFEIVKASTRLSTIQLKPATSFIASFILIIMVGTGLLMLPASTTIPGSMSFIDALFTSTSATCVTGLIVVDTATFFTFKGQLVILALIQLGGIGIVSFATFFATFLNQNVGLKHQTIIQEHLSSETLFEAKGLLKKVVLITLLIETIGSIVIFFTWGNEAEFESLGKKIFFSIFHSISAFNNAGFSLYSNGLYESPVRNAYILHIVIALIVILGGLGFNVITDLFSPASLRERLHKPWKDWHLGTKLAIYSSLALIVVGMVLFYGLEKNNTLKGMKLIEALITSFFQSAITRTAGFNTVDFTVLTTPTLVFMTGLMFIGASPGSTGGGIKTTTFILIAASFGATITGKKNVDIGKRHIPNEIIFKAFAVFSFAVAYNLLGVFVLTVTDPDINVIKLAFEQFSAFATVGLSTGITPTLSLYGKIMITISMFLGRIGTITLALALSRRISTTAYKYPTGYVMVG